MARVTKRFIVKKYVFATSAIGALRKEKSIRSDDCWVDEEWMKENKEDTRVVGFKKKHGKN